VLYTTLGVKNSPKKSQGMLDRKP